MKILITGASGLLGTELVKTAWRAGHDVTAVYRTHKPLGLAGLPRCCLVQADLSETATVERLFKTYHPHIVWHAAARIPQTGQETAADFAADNIKATQNLLAAARASNVRQFVFSSSMSVYGTPEYLPVDEAHSTITTTPYAASKLAGEVLAQQAAGAMRVTILRFSGIYGRGQKAGAIPAFISRCLRHEPLTLHAGGEPSSDFVWVEDAAQAHLLTLKLTGETNYQVFNIGSGEEFSVKRLAETIRDLTHAESPVILDTAASFRAFRFAYNIGQARAVLGYEPTAPEVSLSHYIKQWAADNKAMAATG